LSSTRFRNTFTALFLSAFAVLAGVPESAEGFGKRRSCGPVYYMGPPVVYHCAAPMYASLIYAAPAMSPHQPYAHQTHAQPSQVNQPDAQRPTNAPMSAPPQRMPATVGAYDNNFAPKTINVPPGTTVRWQNFGTHPHTVTSKDGHWDSGNIAPGVSYTYPFATPGTYCYFCRLHQGMEGAVVVGIGGPTGLSGPARTPGYR
jgi:plastocyanin